MATANNFDSFKIIYYIWFLNFTKTYNFFIHNYTKYNCQSFKIIAYLNIQVNIQIRTHPSQYGKSFQSRLM